MKEDPSNRDVLNYLRLALTVCTSLLLWNSDSAVAQNCGVVDSFIVSTTPSSTPGNTIYSFDLYINPTTGGSKGIDDLTIDCGTTNFIFVDCMVAPASGDTVTYGPYDVATCTSSVELIYTGKSNSGCTGTNCGTDTLLPVPVKLLEFGVKRIDQGTLLNWTTSQEIDNLGFEIHKSSDGQNWKQIGWVPGNGTSNALINYTFHDQDGSSTKASYRLKQVDLNGDYKYSKVVSIMETDLGRINFYPNPNGGRIYLNSDFVTGEIFDLQGKSLLVFETDKGSIDVQFLPAGMYWMSLVIEDRTYFEKLIIQ